MSTYCFPWFCGLAGWSTGPGLAWPGRAPCGLTPGLTPRRPGLVHVAAKDFQRQGTASPTYKQVSASDTFTYCCALAKTNHMAKPGAGEEITQGEEAETPSANDRLPGPGLVASFCPRSVGWTQAGPPPLPGGRDVGCSPPTRGWMLIRSTRHVVILTGCFLPRPCSGL